MYGFHDSVAGIFNRHPAVRLFFGFIITIIPALFPDEEDLHRMLHFSGALLPLGNIAQRFVLRKMSVIISVGRMAWLRLSFDFRLCLNPATELDVVNIPSRISLRIIGRPHNPSYPDIGLPVRNSGEVIFAFNPFRVQYFILCFIPYFIMYFIQYFIPYFIMYFIPCFILYFIMYFIMYLLDLKLYFIYKSLNMNQSQYYSHHHKFHILIVSLVFALFNLNNIIKLKFLTYIPSYINLN